MSKPAATKMGILDRAPDGVTGSDQIWFAAIGPPIKAIGLISGHWTQSQIASTALKSLQLDSKLLMPMADKPIDEIFISAD